MAETKTRPSQVSVESFLAAVDKPGRRADAKVLREMMERLTGQPATMWGPPSSASARITTGMQAGTRATHAASASRSASLVLYVGGFPEYEELLTRLGKHRRSKACLYVNKLADVDLGVLEEITRRTFRTTEEAGSV